jgi:hypothetical protein
MTEDLFWGRCTPKTPEEIKLSPFRYDKELPQPHWREDNTCSHCGGIRPSLLLKALKEKRVSLTPTDKNYKVYYNMLDGTPNLSGYPGANKCYFNHFSESQAVELVLMWHRNEIKFEVPGSFYSGLCFGIYKDAIEKALADHRAANENNPSN